MIYRLQYIEGQVQIKIYWKILDTNHVMQKVIKDSLNSFCEKYIVLFLSLDVTRRFFWEDQAGYTVPQLSLAMHTNVWA